MEYKVISKIVKLDQEVRSTTIQHDAKLMQRSIEWLKYTDDEDGDFFTLQEATDLKKYLDSKKNFSDNQVVKTTSDDGEPSIPDMMNYAKDYEDGKIAESEPIKISQCPDLRDYNLPFEVEGFLNTIDLT